MAQPDRLTTAQALLVETLVAHKLLGATHTTLHRDLWIKPQLDELHHFGLLDWRFDEDANFRVTVNPELMQTREAMICCERLGVASAATPIGVSA